jgi:plasmid stabilization system protein ParE
MRYALRVDDRAHDEITSALQQLNDPERRIRFRAELEDAIDTILEFPDIFPTLKVAGVKTDLVVRRVLLRGFYHGLIYTVLDDIEVVRVLKCYYTRSNPETWLTE